MLWLSQLSFQTFTLGSLLVDEPFISTFRRIPLTKIEVHTHIRSKQRVSQIGYGCSFVCFLVFVPIHGAWTTLRVDPWAAQRRSGRQELYFPMLDAGCGQNICLPGSQTSPRPWRETVPTH